MKPSETIKKQIKGVRELLKVNNNLKEFEYLLTEVPERIQRRTRLGKGVTISGELKQLDKLSEKYVDKRKNINLPTTTKPTKSNLTLSGAMLASIKGIRQGSKFIFQLMGSDENKVSNADKAEWNALKGRRFFDLSKTESQGIQRMIEATIRDLMRNIFK